MNVNILRNNYRNREETIIFLSEYQEHIEIRRSNKEISEQLLFLLDVIGEKEQELQSMEQQLIDLTQNLINKCVLTQKQIREFRILELDLYMYCMCINNSYENQMETNTNKLKTIFQQYLDKNSLVRTQPDFYQVSSVQKQYLFQIISNLRIILKKSKLNQMDEITLTFQQELSCYQEQLTEYFELAKKNLDYQIRFLQQFKCFRYALMQFKCPQRSVLQYQKDNHDQKRFKFYQTYLLNFHKKNSRITLAIKEYKQNYEIYISQINEKVLQNSCYQKHNKFIQKQPIKYPEKLPELKSRLQNLNTSLYKNGNEMDVSFLSIPYDSSSKPKSLQRSKYFSIFKVQTKLNFTILIDEFEKEKIREKEAKSINLLPQVQVKKIDKVQKEEKNYKNQITQELPYLINFQDQNLKYVNNINSSMLNFF